MFGKYRIDETEKVISKPHYCNGPSSQPSSVQEVPPGYDGWSWTKGGHAGGLLQINLCRCLTLRGWDRTGRARGCTKPHYTVNYCSVALPFEHSLRRYECIICVTPATITLCEYCTLWRRGPAVGWGHVTWPRSADAHRSRSNNKRRRWRWWGYLLSTR